MNQVVKITHVRPPNPQSRQKVLLEPAMSDDDIEDLLEKAQELQTELNDLHQQRMSKSDNADDKLVMFRKQVRTKGGILFKGREYKPVIDFLMTNVNVHMI